MLASSAAATLNPLMPNQIMKPTPASHPARPVFSAILLAAVAVVFSSCRTTEGFGRDLQKVGNKIESEAAVRG